MLPNLLVSQLNAPTRGALRSDGASGRAVPRAAKPHRERDTDEELVTVTYGASLHNKAFLTRGMAARSYSLHAVSLAVFLACAGTATFAQQTGRPLTAAMIFLFGVTLVGALEGLRGGLVAALTASLTYNFFLSDPVFRFSLTSAEEYVPLIAFNLSAAASGLLAGRLKDRALAAEYSSRRMRALLDVSQRLQAAVRVDEIPEAIASFALDESASPPEIYLPSGDGLQPLKLQSVGSDLAHRVWFGGCSSLIDGNERAFMLSTLAGPSGVLVMSWRPGEQKLSQEHEIEAFLNLLSIALERCLLLERLAEAELVKRSEELKTALLSSVSHDMRTPLSAISASASSLVTFGSSLSDDTRADLLNMIQEQCDKLNRYTTNLLNLGRIQAGMDGDQFVICDALEVLGSAISLARSLGTGHEFIKKYDLAAANVRVDPVMLEQVFYNVLENAARYSPAGSQITISAAADTSGRIVIRIADEGEGIPTFDLERVFERFYRSRSVAASEGSGLGLSIARGFTEAFGGSIEAMQGDVETGGTIVNINLMLNNEGAAT